MYIDIMYGINTESKGGVLCKLSDFINALSDLINAEIRTKNILTLMVLF